MNITVDVNAAALLVALRNGEKRVRFAISNAINATARDVQKAERAAISTKFRVRKPDFILRQAAIIKPFSSPTTMEARISVGRKERLLLRSIELGKERIGQTALRDAGIAGVGVPTSAVRPSPSTIIPTSMWIARFNLQKGTGNAGPKGVRGTFVRDMRFIFQQVAGAARARLLYVIKPQVKKAKPFGFADVALATANSKFQRHLDDEVVSTLKRAMGG